MGDAPGHRWEAKAPSDQRPACALLRKGRIIRLRQTSERQVWHLTSDIQNLILMPNLYLYLPKI